MILTEINYLNIENAKKKIGLKIHRIEKYYFLFQKKKP